MNPQNKRITPERVPKLLELLLIHESLQTVAKELGVGGANFKVAAAPYIAELKAAGALPKCPCGRDRFHRYGCKPRREKVMTEAQFAKRAAVLDMLTEGVAENAIDRLFGMGKGSARLYSRHLTPAQLRNRHNRRTGRDDLFNRIAARIPRWLSPASRDDAISEIYLAVMEGQLSEEDVTKAVDRIARDVGNSYESKFGNLSLDEFAFDDSGESFLDRIEDPNALSAFDYLDDLELGTS